MTPSLQTESSPPSSVSHNLSMLAVHRPAHPLFHSPKLLRVCYTRVDLSRSLVECYPQVRTMETYHGFPLSDIWHLVILAAQLWIQYGYSKSSLISCYTRSRKQACVTRNYSTRPSATVANHSEPRCSIRPLDSEYLESPRLEPRLRQQGSALTSGNKGRCHGATQWVQPSFPRHPIHTVIHTVREISDAAPHSRRDAGNTT